MIEYGQIGPGYNDASLTYNGSTASEITGTSTASVEAGASAALDSDADHSVETSIE